MCLQKLFAFGAQKEKTGNHNKDNFSIAQFVDEHLINESNQCEMNRAVQPRSNLSQVLQVDHWTSDEVAIICTATLSK